MAMIKYPDRIPYETWTNSQLSTARHFGGCTIGEEHYYIAFDSCTPEIVDGEELWKPDLVRSSSDE